MSHSQRMQTEISGIMSVIQLFLRYMGKTEIKWLIEKLFKVYRRKDNEIKKNRHDFHEKWQIVKLLELGILDSFDQELKGVADKLEIDFSESSDSDGSDPADSGAPNDNRSDTNSPYDESGDSQENPANFDDVPGLIVQFISELPTRLKLVLCPARRDIRSTISFGSLMQLDLENAQKRLSQALKNSNAELQNLIRKTKNSIEKPEVDKNVEEDLRKSLDVCSKTIKQLQSMGYGTLPENDSNTVESID